jgi:hypothetical protein
MPRTWIAFACACVALGFLATPTRAADVPGALKIVPGDAAGFVTVDVPGVLNSPLCDEVRFALGAIKPAELAAFAKKFPVDPTTVERVVVVFPNSATVLAPLPDLHPTAVSALAVVGCSKPFDPAALAKGFMPTGRPKSYGGRVYQFDEDSWVGLLIMPDNRTFVLGAEDSLVWLIDRLAKGDAGGPLAPARGEVGSHTIFAAINPAVAVPPEATIPPALKPLAKASRACVAIDLGKTIRGSLEFHYADAAGAVEGETALKAAIALGREKLREVETLLQQAIDKPAPAGGAVSPGEFPERFVALIGVGAVRRFDETIAKLPIERKGGTVRVEAEVSLPVGGATVIAGLAGITLLGTNANSTFQYVGNSIGPPGANGPPPAEVRLKTLEAAFAAYHAEHGHYPPAATYAKDGTPLLSWRVALLPYLGEKKLHQEFRHDEPWDSLHNKKLIAKMPAVFNKPYQYPRNYGKTNAQVVTGPGTLFGDKTGTKKPNGGARLLAVESEAGSVWWTKPADVPFTAGKAPEIFAHYEFGSTWVVLTDGTVQSLRKKDDAKRLPELIAPKRD